MKVFNEEVTGTPGLFVIVMDKKDAQALLAMCEFASVKAKRKTTWRKIWDTLRDKLCCY